MCVIRPATPARVTADTESPPPTMVVPFTAATASATALVPASNGGVSNTPIGPFHTTVFAPASRSQKTFTVAGPMSSPIRSPIDGSPIASVAVGTPASIRSATTWSVGSASRTPRVAACSSMARAASSFSSSTSERPTGAPPALRNV